MSLELDRIREQITTLNGSVSTQGEQIARLEERTASKNHFLVSILIVAVIGVFGYFAKDVVQHGKDILALHLSLVDVGQSLANNRKSLEQHDGAFTKLQEKLTQQDIALAKIQQSLADMQRLLTPTRLAQAAASPNNPKSQQEASDILARSKTGPQRIPKELLQASGQSFVDASAASGPAWSVALQFAGYRSFLNEADFPPITGLSPENQAIYRVGRRQVVGKPNKVFAHTPYVPIDRAAVSELIGEGLNPGKKTGPDLVVMQGGALILDDMRMEHVVFDGVEIYYSGGPSILKDVQFINCTFQVDNNEKGRSLVRRILSDARVDFQSFV